MVQAVNYLKILKSLPFYKVVDLRRENGRNGVISAPNIYLDGLRNFK